MHFTTSTACVIAGIKPVTLRSWRQRHGFPGERSSDEGWQRFSFADLVGLRIMANLIERELSANVAASVARQIAAVISEKDDKVWFPDIAIAFFADRAGPADELVIIDFPSHEGLSKDKRLKDGRAAEILSLLISVETAAQEVARDLEELGAERIMTASETSKLIYGTLAEAIRPDEKGET